MVAALYDRIDANEQFAADVAHEIKNPLASLRSAVGTLRIIKRDDQREKLLDVVEHDVRRPGSSSQRYFKRIAVG